MLPEDSEDVSKVDDMIEPLVDLLGDQGIQGDAMDQIVGAGVGIAAVQFYEGESLRKLSGPSLQETLAQTIIQSYVQPAVENDGLQYLIPGVACEASIATLAMLLNESASHPRFALPVISNPVAMIRYEAVTTTDGTQSRFINTYYRLIQ